MATLSPAQIYALARNAGLSPAKATIATAVALGESGGRTDAVGDVGLQDATWGPSVGLWQIRSVKAQYGTGGARDASRLTDPAFNAQSMAQISGGGGNFKPWTVYTKGTYKQYLTSADQAAVSAGDNPNDTGSGGIGGKLSAILGGIGAGLSASTPAAGVNPGSAAAAGVQTGQFLTGWAADAMRIGLYILGAAAAAGLVIVGAVHTVSEK